MRIGDTTVVFWAENAEEGYAQFLSSMFDNTITDYTLKDALQAIASGYSACWQGETLSPENRFYILGLAPNAARLSVRFFFQDSFGSIISLGGSLSKRV